MVERAPLSPRSGKWSNHPSPPQEVRSWVAFDGLIPSPNGRFVDCYTSWVIASASNGRRRPDAQTSLSQGDGG